MVKFRSLIAPLFVPANRPDRFQKADQSGADAIILDLEDAVAPADKDNARKALLAHAGSFQRPIIVRINGTDTPFHDADLAVFRDIADATLMLPKTESLNDIASVTERLGANIPVIALIETARGLAHLPDILTSPHVVMAAFGSVDFSLDIGCAHERLPLLAARSEIVWRSRAADLRPPLDGVTTDLQDMQQLDTDARHSLEMGFGGKMAVHPKQIAGIRQAFQPDEQACAWARKVLAAAPTGEAVQIDGKMIDRPVIEQARRILARMRTR